jgi:hypothetical protein
MARLKRLEVRIRKAPDPQISLTDPDARSMATSGRGTGMVGYNVQAAVEAEHHLIVTHEVANVGHARDQLFNMASQAKEAMGTDALEAVADRGYFKGEQILACAQADITTYLSKPQTSSSTGKGLFRKRDFVYHPRDDEYQCPAGERLIWRFEIEERGLTIHKYFVGLSAVCAQSPVHHECLPARSALGA